MSQITTEQWERRKWYLIRSLFNEVPLLSPIPELQELALGPSSPIATTSNRPYSPLPDLIIEREPNRHDESEEYYQALERKLLKFYRKLFVNKRKSFKLLEEENDGTLTFDHNTCTETAIFMEEMIQSEFSSSNNESTNSNDQSIDQDSFDSKNNVELTSTFLSENASIETEVQPNKIHRKTKAIDSSMSSTISSDLQNNEIIVTQALVHRAGNEEIDNRNHYMSDRLIRTGSLEILNHNKVNNAVATSFETDREYSEEASEHEHLERESAISNISNNQHDVSGMSDDEEDVSTSPEKPEIMRRRITKNDSVESINSLDIGRYFSADFSTHNRSEITYVREMEEAGMSSPELSIILGTTSTSKIVRSKQECSRPDGSRKRQILSEIPSHLNIFSPKQRKFENLGIQTSFSVCDNHSNWHEIQKDFFEGNPRIFKLCSCSNHVCC